MLVDFLWRLLPLLPVPRLRVAAGESAVTETFAALVTNFSNDSMRGANEATSVPSISASPGVALSIDLRRDVPAALGVLPLPAVAIGTGMGFRGILIRGVEVFRTGARLARVPRRCTTLCIGVFWA